MDRRCGTNMQQNITQSFKRRGNVMCSTMDGDPTKRSKSERERQMPYHITYMWNIKYDPNEHIYETETDSQT